MPSRIYFLAIFFLVLFPSLLFEGFAQSGAVEIVNYSNKVYKGGSQTWDIVQDKNGLMYMANNEGLLTFDGNEWAIFPLPNKTIVRSVCIANDKIFVGGQDEIGYFTADRSGKLEFNSITSLLPDQFKSFSDIWDIVSFNDAIYFRSSKYIFQLKDNKIITGIAPTEWLYMGSDTENLYCQDAGAGLLLIENDKLIKKTSSLSFPKEAQISGILRVHKDTNIITTLKHGLYKSYQTELKQISFPGLFKNAAFYTSTLCGDKVVIGTSDNGLLLFDKSGHYLQQVSAKDGLQTNNCLSVFTDVEKNLWLGLNNGIDRVSLNNTIIQIKPAGKDGAGYASIQQGSMLYLGTSDGLFSTKIDSRENISRTSGEAKEITEAKGQIWGLSTLGSDLVISKHEGAYTWNGKKIIPIDEQKGYWKVMTNIDGWGKNDERFVAGNYKGLSFLKQQADKLEFSEQLAGFEESSRYIEIDNQGNTWISHPYHGVYQVRYEGNFRKIKKYSIADGLPAKVENYIFKINNNIVAATSNGIYYFNPKKSRFEIDGKFAQEAGRISVRYLKQDKNGRLWFVHDKQLGVYDLNAPKPIIYISELNEKILSGFESVYPFNEQNILIGGLQGFYIIDYAAYRADTSAARVGIARIILSGEKDSTIFPAFYWTTPDRSGTEITRIRDVYTSLRFQFNSTSYQKFATIEYSYMLSDFDKNWSIWSNRTEKEYTNLPPGKYTMLIKARSANGIESSPASYEFDILPHWYESNIALILYCFTFIGLAFGIRWFIKRKLRKQAYKYKLEQEKQVYIHNLEQDKRLLEIEQLQNEKLAAEINFKNSELASSAMHLVKKGEMLTLLRTELQDISKSFRNSQLTDALKKIMGSLREDEKLDEDWESFSNHFDKVHSDFTKNLKHQHPKLSGNDVKLCVNLRMNMSTKEIAQLMHISVRGVEISRYRLRKKLELEANTSLYDYLISI